MLAPSGASAAIRSSGDDEPVSPSGITSISPVNGRGWRLEATGNVFYDDNILHIGDGQAPPTGEKRADFRFSPSASAAIGMPFGRQQFYLGGLVGRDFYGRNTILNRNRYLIGGGLNWRLGASCTGSLAGEFRRRQNLLSEVAVVQDNVQETQVYGADANCQAPVGLGFGGHVNRTQINNLNPLRQAFDSRSTVFGPSVSYGSPGLGRFSLSGDVTASRYPRRTVPTLDGNNAIIRATDGVDIYSGRVGYQRNLGTRFSLQLGVSYLKVKPKPGAVVQFIGMPPLPFVMSRPGYSGGGYDATISYTPSARINAQFVASRNITSSANVGALFTVAQTYGVDLGYEIGPSINVGLGGTINRRDYRGSFPSVLEPQARISDELKRIYAHVTYAPVQLYSLDFELAHQQRNSNPDIYNYKGTSATLSLRLMFGRR